MTPATTSRSPTNKTNVWIAHIFKFIVVSAIPAGVSHFESELSKRDEKINENAKNIQALSIQQAVNTEHNLRQDEQINDLKLELNQKVPQYQDYHQGLNNKREVPIP